MDQIDTATPDQREAFQRARFDAERAALLARRASFDEAHPGLGRWVEECRGNRLVASFRAHLRRHGFLTEKQLPWAEYLMRQANAR